jgi:hypothetical protein
MDAGMKSDHPVVEADTPTMPPQHLISLVNVASPAVHVVNRKPKKDAIRDNHTSSNYNTNTYQR